MEITVLGSCANQISDREGVSLLVEHLDDNLLIDCGPGIVAALGRARRKASDINNVLLTHVHGDHISGFAYFVWNRNFERMGMEPAKDIHVYGLQDTITLAKFMLEHCYPELNFPFQVVYHTLELSNGSCKWDIGGMNLTAIEACHTVPCISCVITGDNKKFVYSSDTLPTEALAHFAKDADLVVHEGMMVDQMAQLATRVKHSLASQAGSFASSVGAKQLLLVHVAPGLLGNERALLTQAATNYSGPISIPYDGSVYHI